MSCNYCEGTKRVPINDMGTVPCPDCASSPEPDPREVCAECGGLSFNDSGQVCRMCHREMAATLYGPPPARPDDVRF